MAAQFISDLHLDPCRPDATHCLLRFLAGPARDAGELYILGDLFEAYVGDDATDDHAEVVACALKDFTTAGHQCAFVAGNRDFLLGPAFATRAGLTLLPEESVVPAPGGRVLLMHGDTLCTDDRAYQRYRRVVRNPLVSAAFLGLPARVRRRVAGRLRDRSMTATAQKPEAIMDVNGEAVSAALDRHDVATLVHGHTHRPGAYPVGGASGGRQRLVLGAWHTAGHVLRLDGAGASVLSLTFG